MNMTVRTKEAYIRPEVNLIRVEVESNLMASSVTEYENAGSAGEGSYDDNPFGEFGTNSSSSGISAESFDGWTSF
jgi:hypothetical protein